MRYNWKEVKLSEIVEFNPKESIKKHELAKKIPMDKLIEFSKKISGYEIVPFKGGTKFKNGDTLQARITPCLENGKTAYVDILEDNEVAFGSTEYNVWRAIEGISDSRFLYYLSISPEIREASIKSMTGTTGRQRTQIDLIKNIQVKVPELKVQIKIAEILSSLDEKINLNDRLELKLEDLSQLLFKSWFVDFNFPDDEGRPYKSSGGEMIVSELGNIPKDWEVVSLTEIANYKNGLAMQKYRPTEGEEGLPVLKIKELNEGVTSKNSDRCSGSISEEVKISNGDVIFSWSGTLLVRLWTGGNAGLNQHLFKVTSNIFPKWFYYLWTKHHLINFRSIAKDKATTMGHINRSHLEKSLVAVPTLKHLQIMSEIMEDIIMEQINLGVENQYLKKVKDTLLPKLLSGEIEVPVESKQLFTVIRN